MDATRTGLHVLRPQEGVSAQAHAVYKARRVEEEFLTTFVWNSILLFFSFFSDLVAFPFMLDVSPHTELPLLFCDVFFPFTLCIELLLPMVLFYHTGIWFLT